MIRSGAFEQLDIKVASARIVLSLLAMLSLYIDPTTAGGMFHLTGVALAILLCHLAYSVGVHEFLRRGIATRRLPVVSTTADVGFATAVALLTEGQTSPSYVFFVFAIVAAGVRLGSASTIVVTIGSVSLYLLVIALIDGITSFYIMRAVYLAIAGYLIGFVGQQRAVFELRLRELETTAERHSIARSLHDGYVQALAGIRLRLESCRELLVRERANDAIAAVTELQSGVAREYDEVRAYIRDLAGVEGGPAREAIAVRAPLRFCLQAAFETTSEVGEQILQIVLEGLRNARRHAMASVLTASVSEASEEISITISDDGIGFGNASSPWVIASRVKELGGNLTVKSEGPAHLEIVMPNA